MPGQVALYDSIGQGYNRLRRPDARIAHVITRALGEARSIVNVGAGTGSYEPLDRAVVAVEPSLTMIRQRPPQAAAVLRGSASDLPFRAHQFDAALAVLTLHHWPDLRRGLRELRRVSRRVVLLTWDPQGPEFWLTHYLPEILALDRPIFPTMEWLRRELGGAVTVENIPIPHDCVDGFLGAYWRRPASYLDAEVRAAISTFARFDPSGGLAQLRQELASGAWEQRYANLLTQTELDLGYRLVTADAPGVAAGSCERETTADLLLDSPPRR